MIEQHVICVSYRIASLIRGESVKLIISYMAIVQNVRKKN